MLDLKLPVSAPNCYNCSSHIQKVWFQKKTKMGFQIVVQHARSKATGAEVTHPRGALDEAGVNGEMAKDLWEEPRHRRQWRS